MRARLAFLLRLFLVQMAFFALAKAAFLLYNGVAGGEGETAFTAVDVWEVVLHGLPMDASTACYLLALPFLLTWVSLVWARLPLRTCLVPYYILAMTALSIVTVVDTSLYAFWQFKLDATVLAYADSPREAMASVSLVFVVIRVLVIGALSAALSWLLIRLTPKHFSPLKSGNVGRTLVSHLLIILTGGVLFLLIRGGVGESTMNVGNAYYSDRLFLNHAAVNPSFSLLSSLGKSEDFAAKYEYLPEAERAAIFDELYPADTDDLTDTLLTTSRPHVLFLILEGFGATFVESLGGHPDVTPNFDSLTHEGVYFTHFYSTSFRTDRGTLSALSGHVSYPTTSLMKVPAKSQALPSVAKTLRTAGYATNFLYGGDINFTNMKSYLHSIGYERAVGYEAFTLAERTSSAWGANDSITFERLYEEIKARPIDKPWHTAYLSLSSHEPFEVPYSRLEDPVLNAFAYTDHCLGRFMEQLRTLPVWDNLLVICLPDHSALYGMHFTNPQFFHSPMLWLGGVVKRPRVIDTLMSQSDMAATLLAQLGLPHDDFVYSRNIFSRNYTYPFAYSTFADGFTFVDSTGVTVFDNVQEKAVWYAPSENKMRELRGKALQQTTHDDLSLLK